MGPQAPLKLHFTLVNPNTKSRKAAEIEDAARRPHAARQSHRTNRCIFPGVSTVVRRHVNKPDAPKQTQPDPATISKKVPPAPAEHVAFRAGEDYAAIAYASVVQGRVDPFDSSATKGLPSYAPYLLDLGKPPAL